MRCQNSWFVKFMSNRDSRETSHPLTQEEYDEIAIREVSPSLPLSSASRCNARKEKALRIYLDGEWSSIEHTFNNTEKQLLNRHVWEHETFAYKVIKSCQVFVELSTQQLQNILCFSKSSIFQSFRISKAFWLLESIGFVKFFDFVKHYALPRDFRPRLSRFVLMCFEIIRIMILPITYGLLTYRISFKSTNTDENNASAD